jgi:hypothetical protein
MRSILIACPLILVTLAAAAQMPNMPSGGNMPASPNMPNMPGGGTMPSAPNGTAMPGAGETPNPIDQAKTEAECKIPTNATKPECLKLMLKK